VNSGHEEYFIANGYEGFVTEGFVDSKKIYSLIWFSGDNELVGTNIISTTDTELRNRYSPNIVGHYWLIKKGIEEDFDRVRFSLFYPYKMVFGVEPTMYPSIPFKIFEQLENTGRLSSLEQ
jgi:hypothetical protein